MSRAPRPIPPRRRWAPRTGAAALAGLLVLTGCGGPGDGPATGTQEDIEAALQEETTITFWTWVPDIGETVELFEREYPDITVEVVNSGQSAQQYTNMQNAIRAGSGGPDVAQVEYFALPQFALAESVLDLTDYGFESHADRFTDSAWEQVNVAGGVYGVPQDTGPMVMFYREDLLDEAGIEPPTTWEEFAQAARDYREHDPDGYLTSIDPLDAGGVDSLLWQAGSRPFAVEGDSTIALDLADEGARRFSELWTPLLADDLVHAEQGWTEEWWRGMSSGRYAMWIAGAWAPGSLETTIPETSGSWRVAPIPQWEEGTPVNAENGGSSVAVLSQSENTLAAIGFAQWLNTDPEAVRSLSRDAGLFPATTELLEDPEWLGQESEVMGGQQANQVFAEASAAVAPGWQYLPIQVYANSVFGDTVGPVISDGTPVVDGLTRWQQQIADYGEEQGFTVTTP
ncbi:ABC transporter substrate-binding protein [Marinactinospora rubrisoli]|uniref:ABC transporter substrate-binding protein n=1 Tax=Marinactinospora rubrisoli TaxID=2715399 RepID=A0ABW2KAZ1_9ACTN